MNPNPLLNHSTRLVCIIKNLSIIFFISLSLPQALHAASATLTWNPNNELDLAGYKIYQRTLPSTDYGSPIFSGLPTNPSTPQLTITDLLDGTTYTFIATAFDKAGNESTPSIEKQFTTRPSSTKGSTSYSTGDSSGNSTSSASGKSTGASTSGSLTFPTSMRSPTPGAILTNNSVEFTGRHASNDVFHSLWVGTTQGGHTLFKGPISKHTQLISGLPSQGTIHVRYWSSNSSNSSDPNAWSFTDQTYTMAVGGSRSSDGSSGSSTGGTGTFPPLMSSPAPNTSLTSHSITFTGSHASGDFLHSLWVGTTKGGRTLFSGQITDHSQTVSGLPSQGTIHVRYWSSNSSNSSDPNAWSFTDQTYTMAIGGSRSSSGSSGSSTGGTGTFPPLMSSPTPNTSLTSHSVTFTGSHASGDFSHSLWVGTTKGGRNLSSGPIFNHRKTVSGLPSRGTIYVRYWSTKSHDSSDPNAWFFTDQTYTMNVGQ